MFQYHAWKCCALISFLQMLSQDYILVLWYRPYNDNTYTFEKLEYLLFVLESDGKEDILLGDTYCHLNDEENPIQVQRIKGIYAACGVKQLINEPTRVTVQSFTSIGHIEASNTDNIIESGILKAALSHHYLVFATGKFQCDIKRQ